MGFLPLKEIIILMQKPNRSRRLAVFSWLQLPNVSSYQLAGLQADAVRWRRHLPHGGFYTKTATLRKKACGAEGSCTHLSQSSLHSLQSVLYFFYLLNETNSFRKKLQITRCIFTAIINRIIWWKKNTALIFLQYSWSVGSTQPLIGIKPRWMNHACGHHMTQMLFGNQRIFKVHVSCSCRTAHPVYPNAPRKGTAFGDGIAVSLKIRE